VTAALSHDSNVQSTGTMKKRLLTRWDYKSSLLFVVPAVVSILVFLLYPFVYTLLLSLSKIDLMTGKMTFVGVRQYLGLFRSSDFIDSIVRTIKFALFCTVLASVLGSAFALFLNQRFVGRGFARSILILPWAVPWVVIGIMWHWVLNTQFGSLNGILYQLGFIDEYLPFLSSTKTILYYTALPCVWRQASFSAILLLASIQTIPEDLYEAATIDGANMLQKFVNITLPWMMPTMMIVIMINTLYGLMQFDTVFIMTEGGPANASEIIAIHMYRTAFEKLKLGAGAAIGYVLTLLCIILGLFYVNVLNKIEKRY
jgi:ABC-type sugar transport system permease subunit